MYYKHKRKPIDISIGLCIAAGLTLVGSFVTFFYLEESLHFNGASVKDKIAYLNTVISVTNPLLVEPASASANANSEHDDNNNAAASAADSFNTALSGSGLSLKQTLNARSSSRGSRGSSTDILSSALVGGGGGGGGMGLPGQVSFSEQVLLEEREALVPLYDSEDEDEDEDEDYVQLQGEGGEDVEEYEFEGRACGCCFVCCPTFLTDSYIFG